MGADKSGKVIHLKNPAVINLPIHEIWQKIHCGYQLWHLRKSIKNIPRGRFFVINEDGRFSSDFFCFGFSSFGIFFKHFHNPYSGGTIGEFFEKIAELMAVKENFVLLPMGNKTIINECSEHASDLKKINSGPARDRFAEMVKMVLIDGLPKFPPDSPERNKNSGEEKKEAIM